MASGIGELMEKMSSDESVGAGIFALYGLLDEFQNELIMTRILSDMS